MKKAIPRIEKHDSLSNSSGTVESLLMERGPKRDPVHQRSPKDRPGHEQQSMTLKSTTDEAQATLRLSNPSGTSAIGLHAIE
jgi:hypothetical protein